MTRIRPFLWFDNQAEQAAKFYISIFKNSRITKTSYYGEGAPRPKGSVMVVEFEIDGQPFAALNGGPEFKFTEAVSFCVECRSQKEIDEYWQKLTAGGQESECGWLKDKFGVSWQITPTALGEMLSNPDAHKTQRVWEALLKMRKIDLEVLEEAYEGAHAAHHRG